MHRIVNSSTFGMSIVVSLEWKNGQACIIIVTVQNRTFGLIVDAVHDLGTIYDENIYQVAL